MIPLSLACTATRPIPEHSVGGETYVYIYTCIHIQIHIRIYIYIWACVAYLRTTFMQTAESKLKGMLSLNQVCDAFFETGM